LVLTVALTSIFPLLVLVAPAFSSERPNAVIIVDASRSMWGQIDNVNKIVSVHNSLDDITRTFDGRLNLGLIAYGHRKSSGCQDIETLSPLNLLDASKFNKLVKSIKPRGATPIAAALDIGGSVAITGKSPASLILISDGLDNCRGNPCETAQALKKKYPKLTINVIAFDRQAPEKLESLSCVAKATGGTFQSAVNESELKTAVKHALDAQFVLNSAVVNEKADAAPQGSSDEREQGWQPVDAGEPEISGFTTNTKVNAKGGEITNKPSNKKKPLATEIELKALVTEGGRPIKSGLIWRIFKDKPDVGGRYPLINAYREARPLVTLMPGIYLVNVTYGRSYLTKKITVVEGLPSSNVFVLNSGGLRLNSVLANGKPISPNSVTYTIYSDERDQFGKRREIIGGAKPNLIIRLNAGIYHIESRYGDANAIIGSDVTIEPGKLTEATVNHTASKVTFKLVFRPGGEAIANTQWSIMTPQGDIIKESAGALPTHILAAGIYHVLARHGGQNYKREFTVVPGDTENVEVVIQ